MARKDANRGCELSRLQLEQKAIALHTSGATFRDIAEQCGCSVGTAHKVIANRKQAYRESNQELYEREMTRQLANSEFRQEMVAPLMEKGSTRAIQEHRAEDEHRAKLLGLYRPAEPAGAGKPAAAGASPQTVNFILNKILGVPEHDLPTINITPIGATSLSATVAHEFGQESCLDRTQE